MTAAEVRAALADSLVRSATLGRRVRKAHRVPRVSLASRVPLVRAVLKVRLELRARLELPRGPLALPARRVSRAVLVLPGLKARAEAVKGHKAPPESRARQVRKARLVCRASLVRRGLRETRAAQVSPARLVPAEARGCLARKGLRASRVRRVRLAPLARKEARALPVRLALAVAGRVHRVRLELPAPLAPRGDRVPLVSQVRPVLKAVPELLDQPARKALKDPPV
jgi:hypothetical protein